MARLDELERKFEENPRRYFAPLANEYRKAGDAQRAAELCRSQLPEVPGHISGHIVLGQALYDAGEFGGSRAALETALALDPENIVALRYLGDIARVTGDTEEAERWYSRTLEADSYNEAATVALQSLREPASRVPAVAESIEPTPPAASAESESAPLGFEPPSHVAEVEPSEPVAQAAIKTSPPADSMAEADSRSEADGSKVATEMRPAEEVLTPREIATAEVVAAIAQESPQSAEFTGDLEISTVADASESEIPEPTAVGAESTEEQASSDGAPADPELIAVPSLADTVEMQAAQAPERSAVEAHPPEPGPVEEAIQAEERVMESAAPFVTETMADLYLEQGYPHEALELLLQLAEQRPQDEQLRARIEQIESVIVARRDAAVAAARAERAEVKAAQAARTAELSEAAEAAGPAAEVDSSAFAAPEQSDAVLSFDMHPFEPTAEASLSVRDMFARMDKARPRLASAVTPRPISRRRSDFVPMPEAGAAESEPSDDPFAFPNPPSRAGHAPDAVPRTSGPHPTFNPSTAPIEDFDAWLRGLKGP